MRALFRSVIAIAILGFTGALAAQSTTVEPVPQGPGSVRVSFWYGLTGFNGEVVKQVVNRYNASQSKYWIEAISQPDYDATINKLNTSLAGGELPNVVQVYDIGSQRMIDTKKVYAIQDLALAEKLDFIRDLEPAVASYYTIGGKLWSMPFNSSTPVLFFDRAAFKAAGLDTEKRVWTYEELMAAAKKLTQKDSSGKVIRYGLGFTLYSWILEQELATQGALFAEPKNGREGRANKLSFNSQAAVNWLNFLKSTVDSGVGISYGMDGGANSTARDSAFVTGQAAMTLNSIAGLRGYVKAAKEQNKGVDVGVAYIPRPSGAPGGVIIGGASLWITTTGTKDEQAGAWDFVKFASSAEIQAYFASNTGYYPTRRAAYAVKDMKDALAAFPQFQVAIDQLRETKADYPYYGGVFGTFVKTRANIQAAMEQFITGKQASAKAALDEALRKSNSELAEYNATVK